MAPDVQQMPPDTTYDTTAQEAQTTLTPLTPPTSPLIPTAPLKARASTTQPPAPVSQPPVTPPAATGQGWNWFLRILGVVLAIGGGIAFIYPFHAFWGGKAAPILPDWLVLVALIGSAVLAVAAAALLRSWWAVLIAPVAFFVGGQLALLMARGFDFQHWSAAFLSVYISVLMFTTPLAIVGVVIGVPLGKWVARRMRR